MIKKFAKDFKSLSVLLSIMYSIMLMVSWGFQHILGYQPCVDCVYERFWLVCLLVQSLLVLVPAPKVFSFIMFLSTLITMAKILAVAYGHACLQWFPSQFPSCDMFARFPFSMPLDRWFPSFFVPYADCSDASAQILGLSLPVWLIMVFGGLLVACLAFLVWSKPWKGIKIN